MKPLQGVARLVHIKLPECSLLALYLRLPALLWTILGLPCPSHIFLPDLVLSRRPPLVLPYVPA